MSVESRMGLFVLIAGLGLGLLGDLLLRTDALGLNGSLWIASLVVTGILLSRKAALPLEGEGRWLLISPVLLAIAFAWRDSEMLLVLDILVLTALFGLAGYYARGGQLIRTGLFNYAAAGVITGLQTMVGPLTLLFGEVRWHDLSRGDRSGPAAVAIVRGLLIALPLLLLFGMLFMSADAVFAQFAENLFDLGLAEFSSHLLLTGVFAWLAAGFLRALLMAKRLDLSGVQRPAGLTVGSIELGVALGLVNLLFLAFVLVQFRYFFGGAALIESTVGMTYAEYARDGFFELLSVTALVLPVLLIAHWLLPTDGPVASRMFRFLAGSLMLLLLIIMASALQRMLLYMREFGLTELRLFATFLMGWLAMLLFWFVWTVLRGQRERFAYGLLLSGLAVLALVHLINPDQLIVRTNIERIESGHRFDERYITSLSADGVPSLIKELPRLGQREQGLIAAGILRRWTPPERVDWRSWNWSRMKAWSKVGQHLEALQEMADKVADGQ